MTLRWVATATDGIALYCTCRYQIVREVNRGGNAIVYEAVDTAHGKYKPVALKCHDLRDADPRALDRLKREILNAKDVAHDNVVKLLNVVSDASIHYSFS